MIVELVTSKSFRQLWKELRNLGWTAKKPGVLGIDYRYVPPGGSVNGEEGRDFFTGDKALMGFARRRRLLRIGQKLTAEQVDAALADPFTFLRVSAPAVAATDAGNRDAVVHSSAEDSTLVTNAQTHDAAAAASSPPHKRRRKTTLRLNDPNHPRRLAERAASLAVARANDRAEPPAAEVNHTAQHTAEVLDTAQPHTAQANTAQVDTAECADTAESDTAEDHDTAEATAQGSGTAQGTAEESDTAEGSNDDDGVYDTEEFLDAMLSEEYFDSIDSDDVNLTSVDEDDDAQSDVETDEAMAMLFDANNDSEAGSGDEDDDLEEAIGLPPSALQEMSTNGWNIYDESTSREVEVEAASDYYDGEHRPTRSAQAFADSPLGLFFYFLPKALWIKIAEETNRYRASMIEVMAQERQRRQRLRHERDPNVAVQSLDDIHTELSKWKPVEAHELVRFIGLLLARSLSPQRSSLARHWGEHDEGAVPHGTFGRFMTRKRFEDIARFLHLNDNADDRRRSDRAWKLRPVLQVVEKTFRRGFLLGKRISFDEGMVGSRHQFNPMRVYMKDKPTKWGTKFFMTCCADTAYCARVEIYCGASGGEDQAITRSVLRNVLKALRGRPRKRLIVTDNYYSSVTLSQELLKRGLYHVGTARTNRLGWPKDFSFRFKSRPKKVPRGTYRVAVHKTIPGLTAISWCDSRPVNFLATDYTTKATVLKRREKDGSRVEVTCPQVVVDYATGMGGVDQHDQLRVHRYSIQKSVRMLKYYKSIFLGIVDMAIVNGYIIYRWKKQQARDNIPSHADYVMRLHQALLTVQRSQMKRHPVAEDLAAGPLEYAPHLLKQTTEKYRNKIRQHLCKVCSAHSNKEHRSRETSYYCEECTRTFGGRVALCNKSKPGTTLTCSQVWHETWRNGTQIPPELRKKIRFRPVKAISGEEQQDKDA